MAANLPLKKWQVTRHITSKTITAHRPGKETVTQVSPIDQHVNAAALIITGRRGSEISENVIGDWQSHP